MYYPKSQIKGNLFTHGGELIKARDKSYYNGPYYSTSKGEYFSGKGPNDPLTERLIPFSNADFSPRNSGEVFDEDNTYISNQSYYNARKLEDRSTTPRNPKSSQVLPTEEDYKAGKYTKYFVSKTNEIKFIQVNKTEYLKFKNKSPEVNWSLYEPIELEWLLKGDRKTTFLSNKKSVHLLQNKYPGFSSVFKNRYDRFWKM